MLDGIGRASRRLEFSIFSFQFSIISFLLFTLALILPTPSLAVSTIDFSSAKDFFKEIKVGEKINGDLGNGSIPNPYEGKGQLLGYKFRLPSDIDPQKVDFKLQSCSLLLVSFCLGSSFSENIYVLDSAYKPIGEEFKEKGNLDWNKIKLPDDRTIFLLVGSDDASGTGQFVLSANLNEASK